MSPTAKGCPSRSKVVNTVTPQIGYSRLEANKSGAQVVVIAIGAEQQSQNSWN